MGSEEFIFLLIGLKWTVLLSIVGFERIVLCGPSGSGKSSSSAASTILRPMRRARSASAASCSAIGPRRSTRSGAKSAWSSSTGLAAVIDPSDAARDYTRANGMSWFANLAEALAEIRAEGIIIATPNQLHVANAVEAIASGIPILIEKPIADDAEDAAKLVSAADAAGVLVLVGHHRRHNPMIRKAKHGLRSLAVQEIGHQSKSTYSKVQFLAVSNSIID